MNEHLHYASYKDYLVKYDEKAHTITILNEKDNIKAFIELDGLYLGDKRVFSYEDYSACSVRLELLSTLHRISVHFEADRDDLPESDVVLEVSSRGVMMAVGSIGHYVFHGYGTIEYGNIENNLAIDIKNTTYSSVCTAKDRTLGDRCNALYNKETDTAFTISGYENSDLFYDTEKKCYEFSLQTMSEGVVERLWISVEKDVFKEAYAPKSEEYDVEYDSNTSTLTVHHTPTASAATVTLDGLYQNGERVYAMKEYPTSVLKTDGKAFTIAFDRNGLLPQFTLYGNITSDGVILETEKSERLVLRATGTIQHGDGENCFAINTKDTTTDAIRAAIGPAALFYDNAVYNKQTDSAFSIDDCRDLQLSYDWENKCYGYELKTGSDLHEKICFSVKKDLLTNKYNIDFSPLKKRGKYTAPPAGWMTWYAVKFDACEEAVLRNAHFQAEHLKDFGADTVWVDWEWCHQKYERERFDGVDNFHPDPKKYPNGLGYVADEIKKAGFVPALWMGFTNDACFTEYEKEHPEISLSHHETWSGKYYYDISHPGYLDGYLTKALQQVKDWGYGAVKYDTLPNCLHAHENYHRNMQNPDMTTYKAYRGMIQKTREFLGDDIFMLSCSGSYDPVFLWSSGFFDSARIGPDLFTWGKFAETIGRIRQLYSLHGIVVYNDPDNVVLREQYSTYEQAVSRLCVVSLLGLPLTFGDDLTKLPAERLDLLKRALPVMQIHPTDFNNVVCDDKTQLISLAIELPFESYLVAGVMNLTGEFRKRDISLKENLHLPEGEYLVYDYFGKELL